MLRSKITSKSQTTVPRGVRQALGVGPGDELGYIIEGNRAVLVKATEEDQDEVLGAFLDLLERDIGEHPERIRAVSPELVARIAELTAHDRVDLDEPIHGPVSL